MDIKELLPFLVVIVISIIGSLAKKKPRKNGQPQSKNVFEKMMDELNGTNSTIVETDPELMNVDDELVREEEYMFEDEEREVVPGIEQTQVSSHNSKYEPTSLIEAYNKRKEEMKKGKGWRPLEVIDIDTPEHALELNLHDPDEAKKAFVYSEILKPRYF